ncbi:hypothetical protein ACTA71_005845 [Dictyostelium dimigraforme]
MKKRYIYIIILLFIVFNEYSKAQMVGYLKNHADIDPTQNGVSIVRGGICSIPVVGAAIDSIFGVLWSWFYPKPPAIKYVTPKELSLRLEILMEDMKNYTHLKIDESIAKTCDAKFLGILAAGEKYFELMSIWRDEMRSTGTTSATTKTNLPIVYFIFLNIMEESMILFSIPDRIHFLAKVYIDTAFFYQALLQDGYYFGQSMGLSPQIVNGTTSVPSLKEKIEFHSIRSLRNYALILTNIAKIKGKPDIPNWSESTSTFLYSDVKRYDRPFYFINSSSSDKFGFETTSQPIQCNKEDKAIYVVDYCYFSRNIKYGMLWKTPYENFNQHVDFVTNNFGVAYDTGYGSKSLIGEKRGYHNPETFQGRSQETIVMATFSQRFILKSSNINQISFRIYYTRLYLNYGGYMDNDFDFEIKDNKSGQKIYFGQWTFGYNGKKDAEDFKTFEILPLSGKDEVRQRLALDTKKFNINTNDLTVILYKRAPFSMHITSFEIITN